MAHHSQRCADLMLISDIGHLSATQAKAEIITNSRLYQSLSKITNIDAAMNSSPFCSSTFARCEQVTAVHTPAQQVATDYDC